MQILHEPLDSPLADDAPAVADHVSSDSMQHLLVLSQLHMKQVLKLKKQVESQIIINVTSELSVQCVWSEACQVTVQ